MTLIRSLRDCIRDEEGGGGQCAIVVQELTQMPEFEGAQTTAGFFVTPSGNIIDDHWWVVMDDDSIFDPTQDQFGEDGFGDIVHLSKKDRRHKHYFPYSGQNDVPLEALQFADHLRASNRTNESRSFMEMLGEASGAMAPSDAPQAGAPLEVGDLQYEEPDEQTAKPEDLQTELGWEDLLDENNGVQFSDIIKQALRLAEFARCTPYDINNGKCEDFAFAVENLAKEAGINPDEIHWYSSPEEWPGHVWLSYQGRHYDAETPEGVDRPVDLTMFKNAGIKEVDHPEYMPGGDETRGYDPNYDPAHQERHPTYNRGHPEP